MCPLADSRMFSFFCPSVFNGLIWFCSTRSKKSKWCWKTRKGWPLSQALQTVENLYFERCVNLIFLFFQCMVSWVDSVPGGGEHRDLPGQWHPWIQFDGPQKGSNVWELARTGVMCAVACGLLRSSSINLKEHFPVQAAWISDVLLASTTHLPKENRRILLWIFAGCNGLVRCSTARSIRPTDTWYTSCLLQK